MKWRKLYEDGQDIDFIVLNKEIGVLDWEKTDVIQKEAEVLYEKEAGVLLKLTREKITKQN